MPNVQLTLLVVCSAGESWEEARAICTGAGARLCTVEELEADETAGTG